jgi:isopenicillin-N N-acyltransferase like protein
VNKWLRRILLAVLVLAVTPWAIGVWLFGTWIARPPLVPNKAALVRLTPESRDGKVWLGQSWAGRREGLPVIFLKGSPIEIGYAQGVLLQQQMHALENEFLQMVRGYVPQQWKLDLLKWYVIYRNRSLTDYVPLNYRMEIYGTTLGCPDRHPEIGSYYNRLLNYHAAQDVSYMMIDNPLVSRAGCTSFGAWGTNTAGGHLLTGRNFDWEAADVFSRDRVVVMCEPDDGIPFISLSWAGMAGVVSGMNRTGVSVTLNGAPSSLPEETATPAAIVARDVLQHAHNLPEALEMIRRAKVFVSTLWLVGSRSDGRFVVVEKTPQATQVREPEGHSIVSANHFQSAHFQDSRNTNYIVEATSVSRQLRMGELIQSASGAITAERAVEFLRDRRIPGGAFGGNGHRATLNAFIATHATVMDLTEGIFWAAMPPHQLGPFVAFDVHDFSREIPRMTLPADSVLSSGEYQKVRQAQKSLADGQSALRDKDGERALRCADAAEGLNPGFYQNAALRGRALLELGRGADAARAFEAALAARPAFLSEKRELESMLTRARREK